MFANHLVSRRWHGCQLNKFAFLLALIFVGTLGFAPARVWAQVEDRAQVEELENDRLEKWLEDRGLKELLMRQLRSRVESTSDPEQRQQVARRLANLYAEELLHGTETSQPLIKQTRDLIAVYPQLASGRLRVAMLHARYLEGEQRFREWIQQGARSKERGSLQTSLSELDEDLASAIRALDLSLIHI